MNNLYLNIDCFKLFKKIKEQKIEVNLILTDPPYNISRKNNFKTIGRNGIDFGKWDWNFDQTKWIKEIYEIVKPGGSVLIFNDWKNMGIISKALEKAGFIIKDLLRWIKKNPMPRNIERRYVTDFEYIVWAVKPGGKWTFNFKKTSDKKYLIPEYKGCVVLSNKIHPTQKNVSVLEELLKIHSNKNEIILDPFAGSGSTLIACLKQERSFIASEINKNYYDLSIERLNKLKTKQNLNKKNIKPIINYVGNKYELMEQLLKLFPKKINNFYDVFSGSGVVLFNVEAKKCFFNDVDGKIVKLNKLLVSKNFEEINSNVLKIIKKFNLKNPKKTEKNDLIKKNFLDFRKFINERKIENDNYYFCLYVYHLYSFNNMIRFNKNNKLNVPIGKTEYTSSFAEKIKIFSKRVKKLKIDWSAKDFEIFLSKIKFFKDDFIYIDPPYLFSQAEYNKNWTSEEEKRLLNLLDSLNEKKVKFAVSNVFENNGHKNLIFQKWAQKYKVHFLNKNYDYSYYHRKNNGKTKEVLVVNYEKQ